MTQPATINLTAFPIGSWAFSAAHGESVRILDVETVWNHTVYQVWIPRLATVERVPAESLAPAQPTKTTGLDRITYAVAAARIADALTQDVLLAPLEAGVIPLPHQLYALTRAMTGDRIRYLLADEVGLGKTIEAGLIFRELKLRGLVKRVLVVAPKGLVTQWVQEMQTHFGEEFRLLTPSEFSLWRNLTGAENVWRQFDQVVCPVDSIKPVERRRGWSREKLEALQPGTPRRPDRRRLGFDYLRRSPPARRQHRTGRPLPPRQSPGRSRPVSAAAVGHPAPGQDRLPSSGSWPCWTGTSSLPLGRSAGRRSSPS